MNSGTRLTGRGLRWAQAAWWVVALVYGVLLVASTPAAFSPPDLNNLLDVAFRGWTEAQLYQSFAELGLTPQVYATFATWSNIVLGPAYFALGLLLFWRRPDDWLALLFSITFILFVATNDAVDAFGASDLTLRFDLVSAVAGSIVGPLALMLFPDGRFAPRWMRWVALVSVGIQLWRIFFPAAYAAQGLLLTQPIFAGIAFSLLYRYWRGAGAVQRQQIKWMVFGIAGTLIPILVYVIARSLVPAASQPGGLSVALFFMGTVAWWGFLILWPTGLIVAVLRYRLWDIDVIIRRTLTYAVLSAVLALAYFGSVLLLQAVLGGLMGPSTALATVLSTLVIAALFGPLRSRVQRIIDRRFFRQKYDAARTLARFAASARDETDLGRLSAQLVGVVDSTMQPAHVGLWLKPARKD